MNGDVAEGVVAVHEGVLDAVGDVVSIGHGDGAVNADVEVGDERESTFSDTAFFNVFNAWNGECSRGDFGDDDGRRLLVEDVAEAAFQHATAVKNDDGAGEKCRPAIGADPVASTDESEGNADRGGD